MEQVATRPRGFAWRLGAAALAPFAVAAVYLFASSAESVGYFRLWKPPECVIQGYFHGFEGPKAIRSSGHHSNFVVQTLDGAGRNLAFGPEPVQEQFLMASQHLGYLLHRFKATAHSPHTPDVQKRHGPA